MTQGKVLQKDNDSRRGIEEALVHVARGWFPVNGNVLALVRDRLRDGSYQGRYGLLIADLKKDMGLFTYCLKQVGNVIDGPVQHRSPAEILSSLELDKVEALLARSQDIVGVHTVDPTQRAQMMRLRHSLISSATAETLAERAKLDPNQAFLLASVRQLGLSLVAWNYPRIYGKALISAGKGEGEIEQLLLRTLGYSPLELGTRSALEWCEHPETKAVLSHVSGATPSGTKDAVTETVSSKAAHQFRTFCEIGELLAQVHDPDFFPNAPGRWQQTSAEIERHLGAGGLAQIQAKTEHYGAGYSSLVPNGIELEIRPEKGLTQALAQLGDRLFEKNQYAQRCPPGLVEKFREVYRHILPGQASPTAIKELVEEVIPALGFEKGCVYLVDLKKLQAVPMLRIGDVSIDRFRPLSCSDSGKTAHPVVEALSYQAPIVQENAFINGAQVAHVTGVFGNQEKVGVLYLEMSRDLKDSERAHSLLFFKATRETLNDCLNMR